MTQTQQHCSTNDQLLTFLRGQLSAQEESELQLHLNDCVLCRERLENAAADANAWNEAKQFFGSGALHASSDVSTSSHEEATQGSQRIRQVLDALGPTDDPESLGRIGGYEVTGVVGAGGMGVVLKAHDRSLDRIVAIKVMSPHLASSGSARMRFAREAKAAAAVLHPNVIAIHSVASEDASPYLVMPYVRGASLQKRIDSQGPLPLKDTLRIGAQIAAGLAAAHEQGLVHRDIKPANILLEEGVERVTITDFGLARAVDDASMTCSGVIAGTPQYMSPEQTRGEPIDARSDLFSLGSVLYAMCAGRSPFRAETTYGVLHRIANDNPTPVCEVNSDVPVWLGHIIERLLAKRAEDRFESAAQVAALLEGCLAHVQQPAAMPLPEAVAALAPKKTRRPPIGKFIAAAAGAIALFFAGVLIVLELDKGTLTIESEIDDVPIRIMQGDEVVKSLTVSKEGATTRIGAGKYIVEIGQEFDKAVVKDGGVKLLRGATAIIKVTRINADTAESEKAKDEAAKAWLRRPVVGSTHDGKSFQLAGHDALMHCVMTNNSESLNRLLAMDKYDLDRSPGNGQWTLLQTALQHSCLETTSLLLRYGASPNFASTGTPLPLELAQRSGQPKLVALVQEYLELAVTHPHTKENEAKKQRQHLSAGTMESENSVDSDRASDTTIQSLQGVWDFISVESDGVVTEYKTLTTQPLAARLTVEGDMWMVNAGTGSGGHRVKIDGNKLTFYGMTTSMFGIGASIEVQTIGYGLFKLDGDSLVYLMTPATAGGELNGQNESPIKFPESFETKGTQNNVFRLRKVGAGESAAHDPNSSSKVPKESNPLEARTIDDVTAVYNEMTRQLRRELFNPPIPDLTAEQMRVAMLDAAQQYRKQGKVEIASGLKTSAETNRLADRLTFMGMSGTMSEGFRQITPTFHFEVASNARFSIVLRKAELRYSLNGWSSKAWGDIHPPITGKWDLVSVAESSETLTEDAFKEWRQRHANWTQLAIDEKSLTMAGKKDMPFDFAIDHDSGPLVEFRISQEANTKFEGVLMGNGFVDDTTLVFAVDLEGRSKPRTFHTKDGKTTNLTYRRTGVSGIAATADEAYQAMEKLLSNPKMDWKSTEHYIATVATRMTSNIEFAKYVLDHFRRACAGGESTYQVRRHLLAVLTRAFHAWGQSRWSTDPASLQQHFKPNETWPQEIHDIERSVLESVVSYGRKATRSDIVDFVRAARATHHLDAQPFLRVVLLNSQTLNSSPYAPPLTVPTTPNPSIWSDNLGGTWPDARFVAAVGLAELGDQAAIHWLLDKAKPNDFGLDESINLSRHERDRSGSLRESSRCALTDLFGQPEDSTEAQLREWWKRSSAQIIPREVKLKTDAATSPQKP